MPYIADIEYTIGNLAEVWSYGQSFATMAPLCPYHIAFSFDILPSFIAISGDIDTMYLTAESLDRSDAFHNQVEVTATVVE